MGNEQGTRCNITFSSQQQIPDYLAAGHGLTHGLTPRNRGSKSASRPTPEKRHRLQIPDDPAPAQVRKNTNQRVPRISTASPVEAESNASTETPGSASR